MTDENILQEEQFVISYELLHLLHWLLKYEEAELTNLISQAFLKGYEEKLKEQDMYDSIQHSDDVQYSIVQFFNFLEQNIATIGNIENEKKMSHFNIMKTLDQIDPECVDYDTIKSSVMATAEKINPKDKDEAKNLFLKELLRQWDPKKERNRAMILEN